MRFAAQLGFDIEEETAEAIQELAPMLKKVSAERIQVELVKLLTSVHPEEMHTVYALSLIHIFQDFIQTPFKKSQQTLTIRGFEDYTNI